MAAYMKTDMPFYGVPKPLRQPILAELVRRFPPEGRSDYEARVEELFGLEHREEKYLALGYAKSFDRYVDVESMPVYRDLIVRGAWWDLVDEASTKLVGRALSKDRAGVTPVVRGWIDDGDMWLRRCAIICQVGHKGDTDVDLLSLACRTNLSDDRFFIRKAMGWALRDFARTDPGWVRAFAEAHGDQMAPLTLREATKHL